MAVPIETGFVTSAELALLHAALGENDQAIEWLRRAYEQQTRDLIDVRVYSEFDGMRADARFAALTGLIFPAAR